MALQGGNGLDQAWGHPRYVPETGQIWFATRSGGFWVVELEPQVRAALGLPARPTHSPNGAPPRPAATRLVVTASLDPNFYCTINLAKAALGIVA
jgi:hypothetical protein